MISPAGRPQPSPRIGAGRHIEKESPAVAESELFKKGLQARRDVLGAEYVDADLLTPTSS